MTEDLNGREVIVKLPNEAKEAWERLRFESSLLRMLSHEHIIGYVDSFEYYGLPILIMEYAKGMNLIFSLLEMRKHT